MTPNLLILNASSIVLIGLLALFARHNKKVGWVKHRTTFVEDLRLLQQAWDESDQRSASVQAPAVAEYRHSIPALPPTGENLTGVTGFTSQLSNLQQALKQTVPVTIGEGVETPETVAR